MTHNQEHETLQEEDIELNEHTHGLMQTHNNVVNMSNAPKTKWKVIIGVFSLVIVALVLFLVLSRAPPGPSKPSISPSPAPLPSPSSAIPIRLKTDVVPSHYFLSLSPSLDDFSISGHTVIDLDVKKAVDSFLIHAAAPLVVNTVEIDKNDGNGYKSVDYVVIAQHEVIEIRSKTDSASKLKLKITFSNTLTTNLYGFYRSSYTYSGNTTRWLALTHFEPADARRSFPCFDEPEFKANFTVQLVVKDGLTALSNMPEKNRVSSHGYSIVSFETSVRMSTYLVAFVVGDMESITGYTDDGILVRVFAVNHGTSSQSQIQIQSVTSSGVFALNDAINMTQYFGKWFGVKYALPKVDLVSVPDFGAGAMENWGLITFRETALLVMDDSSSIANKVRVSSVVAHELAHQWFGNYVTLEWWNDLWLNEGFASYMEYLAVDFVHPDWNMWTYFLKADWKRALSVDSLSSTHPISFPVNSPADAGAMFDTITYSKGASLLRMLSNTLGKCFQTGIQQYLQAYAFSNAVELDLYTTLDNACAHVDVVDMMKEWTHSAGYPIITVTKKPSQSGQSVYALSQHRFAPCRTVSSDGGGGESVQTIWHVPITYSLLNISVNGGTIATVVNTSSIMMDSPSMTLSLPVSSDAIKLNLGEVGFYRVEYSHDLDLWSRVSDSVYAGSVGHGLDQGDRFGVVDNAFSESLACGVTCSGNVTDVLSLVSMIAQNETSYIVWESITAGLSALYSRLSRQPCFGQYLRYAQSVIESIVSKLDWDLNDDFEYNQLRTVLLLRASHFGVQSVVQESRNRFKLFLQDPNANPIHPNIRDVVYRTVVRYGEYTEYDAVLKLYTDSTSAVEKRRCMTALSSTAHQYLLRRTLEWAISADVRSQDTTIVVGYVASNLAAGGQELAWEFVKSHWDLFLTRYGGQHFDIQDLILDISSAFDTQYRYDEVEAFFKSHPAEQGKRAVQMALESIASHMKWLDLNSNLCTFFSLSK